MNGAAEQVEDLIKQEECSDEESEKCCKEVEDAIEQACDDCDVETKKDIQLSVQKMVESVKKVRKLLK